MYKVDASQTVVPLTVELFDRADGVHARQRSRTSTSVRPVSVPGRFTNTVGGGVVVWHTHRSSADGERMVSKGPVLYRYEVNGLHETVGNDLTAMLVLVPQEVPDAYHRSGPPDLDISNWEPGLPRVPVDTRTENVWFARRSSLSGGGGVDLAET